MMNTGKLCFQSFYVGPRRSVDLLPSTLIASLHAVSGVLHIVGRLATNNNIPTQSFLQLL